jgi:hypothetical protein
MPRIGLKDCAYCGSSYVYASYRKAPWENVYAPFLLGLVRCHPCMRRHLRLQICQVGKKTHIPAKAPG